MKRDKFYLLIIGALVVANIACILYVIKALPPRRHVEPRYVVVKRLGFDSRQQKAYDALIKTHRDSIRMVDDRILQLQQQLYKGLVRKNVESSDSLILLIATEKARIERIHLNHFFEIKALCKPHQLTAFESMANELANIFFTKPLPPPHASPPAP